MKAFAFTDVLEPAGDKPIRVLARIQEGPKHVANGEVLALLAEA